jgi:hypothetical protein
MEKIHLANAMENFSTTSGAGDDYCKGLLVGLVTGLMAGGESFSRSLATLAAVSPPPGRARSYTAACIPGAWLKDWQREIDRNAPVRGPR